jgi:hypothetical protein
MIIWRSKCRQALSLRKLASRERLTGILDTVLSEDTMAPIRDAPDDLNFAGCRCRLRRGLLGGTSLRSMGLGSMVFISTFPCLDVPWVVPISLDGAKDMLLVTSSCLFPRFTIRMT